MQVALDVVDLLQLQEIWNKRPIITAFTRLETRPSVRLSTTPFSIDELLPRLARLKASDVWRIKNARLNTDPGRIPMGDFSEAYLSEMYPETPSPAEQRQILFNSVYDRFIVAHYRRKTEETCTVLQTLAQVRRLEPAIYLGEDALPLSGSPEWIPASITDEIRSLDKRYNAAEPGTPSAYVVADEFWPLLVKAGASDIEDTIRVYCSSSDSTSTDLIRQALAALGEVAYIWNRSPSVVGLCYQVSD